MSVLQNGSGIVGEILADLVLARYDAPGLNERLEGAVGRLTELEEEDEHIQTDKT